MFACWIYRRLRNDEMMRAIVEDMAKIHLPHTYALLERICERQGIKTPERPLLDESPQKGKRVYNFACSDLHAVRASPAQRNLRATGEFIWRPPSEYLVREKARNTRWSICLKTEFRKTPLFT
jgi:hypothetical protein